MYRKPTTILLVLTLAALLSATTAWASSCSSNPDPSVASLITFAPAHMPSDRVAVINNSSQTETFTVVVNVLYSVGGGQAFHAFSKPVSYQPGQQHTFSLGLNFPTNSNYFTDVLVFDANACKRFEKHLNNNITVTGPTHTCTNNCTIQYQ